MATLLGGCGLKGGSPGPTVVGSVRDSATGEPLAGATVTIGEASTTTLENGTFMLHGLKPGLQPVTVRKTGYKTYQGNATLGKEVTVLPPIYLVPLGDKEEGTISGTVVDLGAPEPGVVGASVRLYRPDGALVAETTSGYMGTFVFEGVPVGGPYSIEAEKPLPTGGRLLGRTEGVEVTAEGATSSVMVVLVEEGKAGGIVGVVKSAEGERIRGAKVAAVMAGKFSVSVRSGDGGTFEIWPLPPGSWEVSASAPGFLSASKIVSVTEGGRTSVELVLSPRAPSQPLPQVKALKAIAYTYPFDALRLRRLYTASLRRLLGGLRPLPRFKPPSRGRGRPPGFVHEIVLEWSLSGDSSKALGFEVLRGVNPQALSLRANIPSPLVRFFSDIDPDLNAGATYFYVVRATSHDSFGEGASTQATLLPEVRPEHPPDGAEVFLSSLLFIADPIPLAGAYFVQVLRTDPRSGVEEEIWTGGPYSAKEIERGIRYDGVLLPQGTKIYWLVVAVDDSEDPRAISLSEVRRLIVR